MTNGEKYKKAFSVLQTSKGSLQEVENMAKLQKRLQAVLSLEEQVLHMQRMLEVSSARFRYGSMAIRRRRP